jgi:Uma2 family endonuclease
MKFMSVLAPLEERNLAPPPYPVYRLSVDTYHGMIDAGMLAETDAVELLEGYIVPKMPRTAAHDGTIQATAEVIRSHLPAGWSLRVQSAITLSDSEPEPDIVVVRGGPRDFMARHPGPESVGLLVEVADASLLRDRVGKARIYARSRISCYWIVNLQDAQLEVYTEPSGPGPEPCYPKPKVFDRLASAPLVLDGQEIANIAVASLLP